MINIKWVNSQQTIEAFRSRGGRIVQVLSSRINLLMGQLATFVQTQKLSNQMLHVRSGKLRASIHALPTRIEGAKIIGEVQQDPTIAFYGVIAERGIVSPYEIIASKQRFLKFITDSKVHFAKSVTHPAMSPKPFMALSEEENKTRILAELNASIRKVIEE